MQQTVHQVVIIGGGMSGLTAAAYLARSGQRVTVLEKAATLGGRAATHVEDGFHFNIGPHALYRKSAAMPILRELGVTVRGNTPNALGGYALADGQLHTLPRGFVSLLTTSVLPLAAKLEVARTLSTLAGIDTTALQEIPVAHWLSETFQHPRTRALLHALLRLSTYMHAPETLSAGSAIAQLQAAIAGNVLYVDRGWHSLVDALAEIAQQAGACIETGQRVTAIEHNGRVQGVQLADGRRLSATAVLIAATPQAACQLVSAQDAPSLHTWTQGVIPVKAACLDIALSRLPRPRALFALGIDTPLYFSVHSAAADLAPEGAAVLHVATYLSPENPMDAAQCRREMEALVTQMQPGWEAHVVTQRYLPNMMVASALVQARQGGVAGRPGVSVAEMPGLFLAGDWVGHEGLLADASLASARLAARAICHE